MSVVRRLKDRLATLFDLLWITMALNAAKSPDIHTPPAYTVVAWLVGLAHTLWWELKLLYWELRLFYGFGDPFWFDLNRVPRSKPASPSKTRSTV